MTPITPTSAELFRTPFGSTAYPLYDPKMEQPFFEPRPPIARGAQVWVPNPPPKASQGIPDSTCARAASAQPPYPPPPPTPPLTLSLSTGPLGTAWPVAQGASTRHAGERPGNAVRHSCAYVTQFEPPGAVVQFPDIGWGHPKLQTPNPVCGLLRARVYDPCRPPRPSLVSWASGLENVLNRTAPPGISRDIGCWRNEMPPDCWLARNCVMCHVEHSIPSSPGFFNTHQDAVFQENPLPIFSRILPHRRVPPTDVVLGEVSDLGDLSAYDWHLHRRKVW